MSLLLLLDDDPNASAHLLTVRVCGERLDPSVVQWGTDGLDPSVVAWAAGTIDPPAVQFVGDVLEGGPC